MDQRRRTLFAAAALISAALAAPAAAQLLPRLPLPSVGGVVDPLARGLDQAVGELDVRALTDLRGLRVRELIRKHPREIDVDFNGEAVVRGEILAVSPSAQSLETARGLNYAVVREETLAEVGVTLVTLAPPKGMDARRALRRLRKADPQGQYDFNHVYFDSGPVGGAVAAAAGASGGSGKRVGLLDTGADVNHPTLKGLAIQQRGFAPGGVKPAKHGTAVASLIAGRTEGFRGAAPGAALLIADVYGTGPTGGSASALAKGLAWMAAEHVPVVNVSLVGPPNATVQAVVKSLAAQGTVIVAAVGNDGPAAPPVYPASFPEVVSVTGVDARGRVLMEAGKAKHIDFAAPGADMAAAGGVGFASVRGTSFAAPIVAGKLAQLMDGRSPAQAKAAIAALTRQAKDLGPKGVDATYGRGVVGEDVRISPKNFSKAGMKAK